MPSLFAIADLHLSQSGEKPMDVFGEAWVGHAGRMATAWDAIVEPDDTVLLPGDLSWARTLAEAAVDLEWIGQRTGGKVLLRGNHDTWWKSIGQVRATLPEGCVAIQNDALEIEDVAVVVGARGWTAPDDPVAEPGDDRIFVRELERLRMSLAHADRRFGRDLPRVAMVHYPPWIVGREPTEVVRILHEGGVSTCVFGHLHGDDHRLAMTGPHDGIEYVLAASDAIGFRPVRIEP